MLKIFLSLPQFSSGISFDDPVLMDKADNISLTKTVNSSDESIAFEIPQNDPKVQYINYLRWWECYDTDTNERLNYGPINQIDRASGEVIRIQGPGRSAILRDYYKTTQTFYYPINQFLDDLRYENFSAQPRTSTIIERATDSDYYGLSKRTKDFAIDEQTGYIAIGRDVPTRGSIRTDQFWTGTGRADHLIVDIGDQYLISKARILLPWWGSVTINNNRVYDWNLQYSADNVGYTTVHQTDIPNLRGTAPDTYGRTLYFGEDGFDQNKIIEEAQPISARYWKLDITNHSNTQQKHQLT